MGGPVIPPRRCGPHGSVKPGPQTPVAIHHNAKLAPPRPESQFVTACTSQAERAGMSTPTIRSTTPATQQNTERKPLHATT